jgi:hypothetical protein
VDEAGLPFESLLSLADRQWIVLISIGGVTLIRLVAEWSNNRLVYLSLQSFL